MNREILFRGKRVETGEWVEGDYFFNLYDNAHIITNIMHFPGNQDEPPSDHQEFNNVIPETVGQFTGRTIKGNKLFDGDQFKTSSFLKQVKFIPERMGFAIANVDDLNNPHTVKVLGDSLWQIPSSGWWKEFEHVMQITGNIHDK